MVAHPLAVAVWSLDPMVRFSEAKRQRMEKRQQTEKRQRTEKHQRTEKRQRTEKHQQQVVGRMAQLQMGVTFLWGPMVK